MTPAPDSKPAETAKPLSDDVICQHCGFAFDLHSTRGGYRCPISLASTGWRETRFTPVPPVATLEAPAATQDALEKTLPVRSPAEEVASEILRIMDTYHEQDARPEGIGTPGGLEHMGDVWRLLRKWESKLRSETV